MGHFVGFVPYDNALEETSTLEDIQFDINYGTVFDINGDGRMSFHSGYFRYDYAACFFLFSHLRPPLRLRRSH